MVGIQSEIGAIKIRPEMYDNPYNNKTYNNKMNKK
jgi:hypothetical protein